MLRDYQIKGIDEIRGHFASGHKKVLLHLATGSGKTTIFCAMISEAIKRGKKCLIVVRRRLLVQNACDRLSREGIDHGVLMADHWNHRPHLPVQVASIDTLIARGIRPDSDLIVIDECHDAVSNGYKEFLSDYDCFMVSVTATPYTDKSLRHLAEAIAHPITMQQLIDQGFLVPFRYFAPSTPNLTGVKISSSTKDYVTDQLEERMVSGKLTGDILDHWVKIAQGRPTIGFAVNIHHSNILKDVFLNNGVKAEHCDADTKDAERKAIIRRLESGETQVVFNVGILCTGVDIPPLGALISARPTKSLNLWIQQCGRGTRIYPGKTDCILLDHAGNIDEHGFPTLEPEANLDGKPVSERTKSELKTCEKCFCVYRGDECPECGHAPERSKGSNLAVKPGVLTEIKALDPIQEYFIKLKREQKMSGRKTAWIYYKMLERFSLDDIIEYVPQWFIDKQRGSDVFAFSPFRGHSG